METRKTNVFGSRVVQSQHKFDESVLFADASFDGVTPKYLFADSLGVLWMVKTGKLFGTTGVIKDYITEYLACKIAKDLNYAVQEVDLGLTAAGNEAVTIKMFDETIHTFGEMGNSTAEFSVIIGRGENYALDWIIALANVHKMGILPGAYIKWVCDTFAVDMLVGNFDRHENNWGFFRTERDTLVPCPLFDFGASLYPKLIDKGHVMSDAELANLVRYNSKSAIKLGPDKVNYYELLQYLLHNPVTRSQAFNSINNCLDRWDQAKLEQHLTVVYDFNPTYYSYLDFVRKLIPARIAMMREGLK